MGNVIDKYLDLSEIKVLVVDDNEFQAQFILELLSDVNIEAKAVTSGREALEILSTRGSSAFGCVLMDLHMPGMDGFETTSKIRGYGTVSMARLPIIAMLNSKDSTDTDRIYSAGMNGWICKPINPETLYATLRRTINQAFLGQADGNEEVLSGKSAYILSDDTESVAPLANILEGYGISVQVFTDFNEVADIAEHARTVDFAFVKWANQSQGYSLTSRLKLFCFNTFKHIIAVASNWAEIETKATELALNAYVLTPFQKNNVRNVLLKLLRESTANSQLQDADFSGVKVLIVDDNDLTATVLQNAFETFKVQADIVNDGKSALERLSTSEPNTYLLVFMDIFMPGMNGFETASEIRKINRADIVTLPIIGISGNSSASLVEKAMFSGMNALLLKPISKASIRTYLEIFQNEKLYGGIIMDSMMNQIHALQEEKDGLTTDIHNEQFTSTLLRHAVANLSFKDFMHSVITELKNIMPACDRICVSSLNKNGMLQPFCRVDKKEFQELTEKCANCSIFDNLDEAAQDTREIKCLDVNDEEGKTVSQITIPFFKENTFAGMVVLRFSKRIGFDAQIMTQMRILSSIIALVIEREKHAQNVLDNAQETSVVLENSPFPVVIADPNGNFLRGNHGFYNILGINEEEMQKKSRQGFLDAFRDEHGISPIEELTNNDRNSYSRTRKIGKRYFQEEFNKVQSPDGNLKRIIGTSIDVTDLNWMYQREHLLSSLLSSLISEDDLNTALLGAITKLVNYYSAKFAFVFKLNVGVGESPIVVSYQRNGEDVFSYLGRKPEKLLKELIRYYGGNAIYSCQGQELLMENDLWGGLVQSQNLKAFHGIRLMVDGKFWGHLGLFFDNTNFTLSSEEKKLLVNFAHFVEMMIIRHNTNAQLLTERDKALEAQKTKSLFFASVSHDIRTPLNSILGFAELLSFGDSTPQEEKEYLNNIMFSGNMLKVLIDDVLDLSRLDQGRTQFNNEPHDFDKVGHDVMKIFSLMAQKNNLQLIVDIEPMPIIEFDVQRIRQILTNYIGNAVKFTPAGSVTLHAKFTKNNVNTGTLEFEVIDTGIGINAKDLNKLAEPFVQLGNPEQQQKGSGLGLAICKNMLSQMGGRQWIRSVVGHGSTFGAVIPGIKYSMVSIQPSPKPAPPPVNSLPAEISNLNVLLVDDVPLNLSVLQAILKKMGINNIYTAKDGIHAFEIIQNNHIDVTLTDASMPRADGRQLAQKIRADERFHNMPIFVITGEVDFAKEEGNGELFNDVLFKPITIEALSILFNKLYNTLPKK